MTAQGLLVRPSHAETAAPLSRPKSRRRGSVLVVLSMLIRTTRLSGPEGDDAPHGIIGRHPDGHAITRNNFDSEAAHAAAQLGEHFVSRVTLHAIKAAGMHGDYRALHVDQIVFTQTSSFCDARA